MKKRITKEQKQAVYEAYVAGDKVTDIAERFGIEATNVTRIAKSKGAAQRRPRQGGVKQCPKCKRKVEVKGAKFCPFCASDLRTAKELLIERIEKATELIGLLPDSARDEMQRVLLDAIAEIKKER